MSQIKTKSLSNTYLIKVGLAPVHQSGIFTTIPCSYFYSPMFILERANGSLRLLVDRSRAHSLISKDHVNHPIITLLEAAHKKPRISSLATQIVLKPITVLKSPIINFFKCLPSKVTLKSLHKID